MRKALAALLVGLMIATTLPANVAADEPEPIAWGVEYDYSNINGDIASMIGIDLQEVFQEVMAAGDDSGIDMLIGSVTSGSTTIVFEQYDGPMSTLDVDGTPMDFSTKMTELTVRHGVLDDFAVHSEWSDSYLLCTRNIIEDFQTRWQNWEWQCGGENRHPWPRCDDLGQFG